MDITRGSLDDISRPASSERSRPGSRVSTVLMPDVGRVCHPSPTSLVVLSDDAPNNKQDHSNSHENLKSPDESLPEKDHFIGDVSDEENEDPELQMAIKKMKILDKILASRISNEKEVKRKGKELHQKLWQELLIKPNRYSEWADEAENTRMFLALAPSSTHGSSEEVDFVPVFGTQVPNKEYERHNRQVEESEKDLNNTAADLAEVGQEERADESEGSQSGVPRGKNKPDFVKKNIELASGAGGPMQMTQDEKYRLEELLRDMEEEEGDNAGKAGCEGDMWVVPVPAGEGYTPEPTERDQLIHIDSRLQLLLPVEDFLSVRSPYPDHSLPQAQDLEAGWDSEGDRLPGEKVLQDIREKRGQERRLQEIQLHLELLGQGQEMTFDTPILLEEQLRTLLEKCEISQSWGHGLGTGDTSPRDNSDTESLPDSTPHLSDSILSELLRDAYTTSFSQLDKATTMCSP
ncbi:fibrous sheath-interacting protein 1 isoform X2 [Coregonus clupeaformis]|uniref:fibrous sheath-interacting protein 1 isoform X2 n=1 Tax=Coregonus clupeaformis TaxID=59861 RepID=UPI001BDF9532|nr:fibrous sheath-interacting protein 1 isoform X2 [Coregonus clupeaformis]